MEYRKRRVLHDCNDCLLSFVVAGVILPVRNKVIEPLARFLLLNAVIAGLGHAV
jgi:hypothetical protein